MMRHLTAADYREMPWANGLGVTIEMMRATAVDGTLLWRFSMATVSENGPFSRFENIERNLTVIDGPGFDLVGETRLRADPLCPVAFAGDVPIRAEAVTGRAVDFNVMTRRDLPKPVVSVLRPGESVQQSDAMLCLFALGAAQFGSIQLARHDLLLDAPAATLSGGPALAVSLYLGQP